MDLSEFLGLVGSTPFGLYLEGWSCIQVGMMFQFGYYQQEKISQPNNLDSRVPIMVPLFVWKASWAKCHMWKGMGIVWTIF